MRFLSLRAVLIAGYFIASSLHLQAEPQLSLKRADLKIQLRTKPFLLEVSKHNVSQLIIDGTLNPPPVESGYLSSIEFSTLEKESADSASAHCGENCRLTLSIQSPEHLRIKFEKTHASSLGFDFRDQGEHYYGVWEHPFNGRIDNRGIAAEYGPLRERVMNSAPHARSPFYFSDRGYGIAARTDRPGRFSFGINQKTELAFETDVLELDVFLAHTPARILELYSRQRPTLRVPPVWAFGSWWWRDDLNKPLRGTVQNGAENLHNDARILDQLGIRATGFIVDRPYGTGLYGWGNFDFAESFGDAQKIFTDLDRRGYRMLVWLANRSANKMYRAGKEGGFLFFPERPESAWPALDLRIPAAKDWFKSHIQQLFLPGVVGSKIDRGDENELPRSLENHFAQLTPEVIAQAFEEKRGQDYFLISRNLHEGGRAVSSVWSGDPTGSFPGLRETLKAGLRSGLAGHPLWGSDVGGYKSAPSSELFARWLALGAVSPIMEVLLEHQKQVLWDDYGTELPRLAAHFANLHHTLIPYLYGQALKSKETGLPLMRPLFLDFPDDTLAKTIWDEFLLGDAFLVAPVLEEGAHERSVYFPKGVWCDYPRCERRFHGPSTTKVAAPLDYIPLFLRQGHPVLTGDIVRGNYRGEDWKPWQQIELFPPTSGTQFLPMETPDGSQNILLEASERRVRVKLPQLSTPTSVRLKGDARELLVSKK